MGDRRISAQTVAHPRNKTRRAITAVAVAGILAVAWTAGTSRAREHVPVTPGADDPVATVATFEADPPATADRAPSAPRWDLPNLDHPRVDYWIERFTSDKREQFEGFLRRSGRYVPMISAKLEERGMPQDLVYLAMIESGFNAEAYSHAHASGLWQFIEATAERYGLIVNRALDERNDPVAATDAALDYLEDLHDRFGSWYLAAAAYNTGENRVGRIMREETGSERGDARSYYEIWERLPHETRDYVPLMIAAARIAKQPARYGFDHVETLPPLAYDKVVVDASTPLKAVAKAVGASASDIVNLNPHLELGRTPSGRQYPVRIPEGTRLAFLTHWPELQESGAYAFTRYDVREGDALLSIARRYGVSVDAIREANGIRGSLIRAGESLRIPSAE